MAKDEGFLSLARRMVADVRPLQESPEYRRLWAGGALSGLGTRMTAVAVPVQVYDLTHSSFAVGAIGLAVAVPLLTLGLLGGSFADVVDRRKLVLATSSLLAVVSLAFAAQAFVHLDRLWLLYVLLAAQSALFAVDQPARRTFIPRLLPPDRIPAATALSFLSFHATLVAGPLVAGVLIASSGFGAVYLADAATFVLALYAVLRLRPMPVVGEVAAPGLRAVWEGLQFVRRQPIVGTTLLADLNATVFGMPMALFPALAALHFDGRPQTVGLLYAAPAIGGVLIAAFSGPLSHIRRQGLAMLVAIAIWGAAIAGFGMVRLLWAAVLLLAIAGAADVINGVFRTTIVQVNTPDALQGRINSVGFVVGAGGPDIGNVEAGVVAALTSPAISAISGGLACLVGVGVLALAVPAFRRYEAQTG